jgi:response regulator receiver domain-containing protein
MGLARRPSSTDRPSRGRRTPTHGSIAELVDAPSAASAILAQMAGPSRIRVLIADDHPIYREGLARAIRERPDLELVCETDDGRTALEEIKRLEPHIAVLDVGCRT